MLPLPGPRCGCVSINIETSTFSPPLSDRIHDGSPQKLTASSNSSKTVSARLLLEQDKYTGTLENPSIPPWITIFHLKSEGIISYSTLLEIKLLLSRMHCQDGELIKLFNCIDSRLLNRSNNPFYNMTIA